MTRLANRNELDQIVELVATHGTDAIAAAFTQLLEAAMEIQRDQVVGAAPHQRTDERAGRRNGYKPKSLKTRVGELAVRVPKTRDVDFYPDCLERGRRSERALVNAIAEMYVKGVSTRKVTDIVQELCGCDVSSTAVSRAAAQLDEELQAWRMRPLGRVEYLIIDARYEKVREGGTVVSCAILTAIGILPGGDRTILGVSCRLSEAEVHWRDFLSSLIARGLHGVQLIVSDQHEGLGAARKACLPGVKWQRCQFHLAQNAMHYVPRKSDRAKVAQSIRTIFYSADLEEAERRLALLVAETSDTMPQLSAWLAESIPQGLTVFSLPPKLQRRLRTTNMLEGIHKEIKRRTRVATLFPNPDSVLRLISAILIEINDEWSTGRTYLSNEETQ